jgi:hypothetical protein
VLEQPERPFGTGPIAAGQADQRPGVPRADLVAEKAERIANWLRFRGVGHSTGSW